MSGILMIISCSETDARIDPSRFFNTNGASVVKTAGGHTNDAIGAIYHTDASTRIGMILVVQHTGCPYAPDPESNIRAGVQALKASPYVRKDIPIVGYVLDTPSGQLREVNISRSATDEEARRRVLSQMDDFGPFWS